MNQIERIIKVMDLLLFQWKSFRTGRPFFDINIAEFAAIAGGHESLVRIFEGFERQGCINAIGSNKDTSEWRYIIGSQGDVVSLNVIQDKLEHYREVLQKGIINENINLNDFIVSYDEDRATIMVGSVEVPLTKASNHDYLCKIMFKENIGVPTHWIKIYEVIEEGIEPENDQRAKKAIEDTVYAIDNKIKRAMKTNDLLFRSQDGHIIRQY